MIITLLSFLLLALLYLRKHEIEAIEANAQIRKLTLKLEAVRMEVNTLLDSLKEQRAKNSDTRKASYDDGYAAGFNDAGHQAKRQKEEEKAKATLEALKKKHKAKSEDRKRQQKEDARTHYPPNDYELHPNGERNLKYNGAPWGKGARPPEARGRDYGSTYKPHFEGCFRDFSDFESRNSFGDSGGSHRSRQQADSKYRYSGETARMMDRFKITELTKAEVKKAHRRLSKLYHPDRNSNANASDKMKEVNTLKDKLLKLCKS